MADWSRPVISEVYVDILDLLKSRDVDAITLYYSTPTNQPTGAIEFNRVGNKFREWNGTAWIDKVLSIEGGGTGAVTAGAARTALGIGSLATQNSNAVTITGGTISGLTSLGISGNVSLNGIISLGSTPITINDSAGNILETAIADGALLARVGGNESITGVWSFGALTTFNGLVNVNNVLRVQNSTGLGASTGFEFASFASPNIGRIFIGDGSGYRLHISHRISSVTTDRFTFYDNGNFEIIHASSQVSLILNGATAADKSIQFKNVGTLVGKITSFNSDLYYDHASHNFRSAAGSVYVNFTNTEAQFEKSIRATSGSSGTPSISFTSEPTTGFYLDAAASVTLDITGTVALRFRKSAGDILLIPGSDTKWAGNFIPNVDNSWSVGRSGNRFSEVWAANGTIQTSDMTLKTIIDEVPGLEALLSLDTFRFKWTDGKDQRIHAGVSAQEVERYLGESYVITDRNGLKHLNYSELIPSIIKAIQELYRRK